MRSKSPLRTAEQYLDCLNEVHLLLQKNLRLNTKGYIKLAICCTLINHYQNSRLGAMPPHALTIYKQIRELLQDEKKQKMMYRLGIHFRIDIDRALLLNRKTFRLMPEILPGSQHL